MSHYDRSYKNMPREEADEKAFEDIREWMFGTYPEKAMVLICDFVQLACVIEHVPDSKSTVQHLNMTFGMAGISGYPFHAFCRRYCLTKYREWMASGKDPVQTDEQGFTI